MVKTTHPIVSVAVKRKGKSSILDAMVHSLSQSTDRYWPELSVAELSRAVSLIVGRPIPTETIRAYIHKRPELFEKVKAKEYPPKWKLGRRAIDMFS